MKTAFALWSLFLWPSLFGYEVKIRVVDDKGVPVPDARAVISFVMIQRGTDIEHVGMTDKNGEFSANGRGNHSVFVSVRKTSHYEARLDNLPNDKDLDLTAVLPRVSNPIPLYANRFSPGTGRGLKIPKQNEWLGYDFEIGDWVSPFGRGAESDIRFKFRNEFKGYQDHVKNLPEDIAFSKRAHAARKEEWTEEKFKLSAGKWDAELEISFAGEREGLFEEIRFLEYSRLKLPHNAPAEGYVPTWRYTANNYSPRTARQNVGFFLRTRVKVDKSGNIISANYAKTVGDIYLVPQGMLMFTYYFNPVPNDRNLEFDPKRNLFPASFPGARVDEP